MKKSKVPDSPATIYNNMSHHYRRLFGAKAVVDSSAPSHLKNRHLQPHHRAASTQSLNKLSSSDSNRTNGSSKFHLVNRKHLSSSTMSLYSKSFVECPRYKKLQQRPNQKRDILDSLIPNSKLPLFKPRILRSNAESKLRQLQSVYFPPRKKPVVAQAWESLNVEIETEDNLKPWVRNSTSTVDKKLIAPHLSTSKSNMDMGSQCSTSSKDSAYEGEGNSSNDDGSRGPSPGCKNQQTKSSGRTSKSWSVQKTERRNEDSLYVKFVRDITDDILSKGVYTNKGLKLVFQRHINENLNRLNLNRMKDEVDKLSDKIGIPKKDENDKIDFGLGSISNVQELTKHEKPYGVPPSLLTPYARPPKLSSIRQISKSLASSSSLDLEKELEALESYSDVELNEAEILDTLTVLNINPRVLENDTSINSTKHNLTVIRAETIAHPRKNVDSNPAKNNTDGTVSGPKERDVTENRNSHEIYTVENASNANNIREDGAGIKHSNSLNEIKETREHNVKIKEGQTIQEINNTDEIPRSINKTNESCNIDSSVRETFCKSNDIELNISKFKQINASLFHDTPHSPQNNKASEEMREENNYSEDDFEQQSDESGDDINEDNESGGDTEIESDYSSERQSQ